MFDTGFLPEYCQPYRNLFEQRVKLDRNESQGNHCPSPHLSQAYPMQRALCIEEGAGFLPPGQVGFCEHTAFLSDQRLRTNL